MKKNKGEIPVGCLCGRPYSTRRSVGGASQSAIPGWPLPLPRNSPQGDSQSLIRLLCDAVSSRAGKSGWCSAEQVVRCDNLESICPELRVAKSGLKSD